MTFQNEGGFTRDSNSEQNTHIWNFEFLTVNYWNSLQCLEPLNGFGSRFGSFEFSGFRFGSGF